MEKAQAVEIIKSLADGVHPITGEVFPRESPYQHAHVVRALFVALSALGNEARPPRGERLPSNAGKPWSDEEDKRLLELFDAGRPIKEIAEAHGRTTGGIQARLAKYERIQMPQQFTAPRRQPGVPGPGSSGK
jgi:hypothetical protein